MLKKTNVVLNGISIQTKSHRNKIYIDFTISAVLMEEHQDNVLIKWINKQSKEQRVAYPL